MVLATFGEWHSQIEGGTNIRLVVLVPQGIKVEQRHGLSGRDSAAAKWHGA
ncbi:MAG TPA: hypothetical protein VFA18_01220 [Gemmataceae bacterium]|nr:hypothetical protein [Gemmataceae bacterium]